jgi:hypothetical protein
MLRLLAMVVSSGKCQDQQKAKKPTFLESWKESFTGSVQNGKPGTQWKNKIRGNIRSI